MEKVFNSRMIRRLLPHYYPTPEETRVQRQILQNIRSDLVAMKIPHSSGMLARKRAILKAVVSELDSNISKFHSILGTKRQNLEAAVERLRSATTETSTRFGVPSQKKREGGLCSEVKVLVMQWWTEETCVSPQQRDVRRKHLGQNSYDTHTAYLLMESQVLSLPQSSSFIILRCRSPTTVCPHVRLECDTASRPIMTLKLLSVSTLSFFKRLGYGNLVRNSRMDGTVSVS